MVAGRNVVLTGFMATGKSTVGRCVADRLGYEFVDTDLVIEERHGPVREIFAESGEGEFRRLERVVAAELSRRSGLVVATGGRMMLDDANADALGATGHIVCLTATVDTIVARLAADATSRPLLAGGDLRSRVTELMAQRAPGYGRFRRVPTDGRPPDEIADEIVSTIVS